jgi:tetratricopeptide (TPR) repeat protein
MFGLFSKKTYRPSVTAEDKDWVEKNLIWLIEAFGLDKLRTQPFIQPNAEFFPYDNLKDTDQFRQLFEQLCKYWDLNPQEIEVKFFDDIMSKQWTIMRPQGKTNEPSGLYYQIHTSDEVRFNIQLAKSNLDKPQLLVSVLAHELAHVKLLGGNYINRNDPDMEPLTDLATIYFGFGVFIANSVITKDTYWIGRSGYLPNQIISYANALICYITKHDVKNYCAVLNGNTIDLFKKDYEFLINTNNTALTQHQVQESELTFNIGQLITDSFAKRNFEDAIEAGKKLLKINPINVAAFNNIGYALLQQKKYQEAIEEFTSAISLNPYWAYPYNNRGYCKIQLGDLENAYMDIYHSLEMDPDNSFSWRNLGAYYLATNELEKALEHFEQAQKIDPKTELINFYIAQVYLKLNNLDLSKQYLEKSLALCEHNDSILA